MSRDHADLRAVEIPMLRAMPGLLGHALAPPARATLSPMPGSGDGMNLPACEDWHNVRSPQ